MKKILSLVLAMMMVLSMANVAFATPIDVKDEIQAKAVDALMSLGIVNGYTDGSYKPENTVTRAEMAKLLVTAKGYGDLAEGSESSFKDAQGTWYDGYVAMAAGLEIVTGYPDGTFKGDNAVSYQEAVVMILRAIGYTNSTVNGGNDAYNASKYKALAASLNILKNISFKNAGANRGDIALMLYNSLEVDVVVTNENGKAEKVVAYTQSVTENGITKTVNVYKQFIDNVAETTTFTVGLDHINPNAAEYKGDTVDLSPYMYQNITAYLNADDEVIVVKSVNSSIVSGTNDSLDSGNVKFVEGTLTVTTATGSSKNVYLPWASNIDVFLNGKEVTANGEDLSGDGYLSGAEVTFVLDKNNVVTNAVAEQPTYAILVTDKYQANATVLKGDNGKGISSNILLPKSGAKVDLTKVTVTGDVTSIEDIEKNDVVVAYAAGGLTTTPESVKLVVTRETVEGTVASVTSSVLLSINGDSYYTAGYAALYTGGVYNTITAGSEGIFYLDQDGYVFAFEGKSIDNSDYAVLVDSNNGYVASGIVVADAYISILNKDGKVNNYGFASSATYTTKDAAGTKVVNAQSVWATYGTRTLVADLNRTAGSYNENYFEYLIVGFDLNSKGQITNIEFKQLTGIKNAVNVEAKSFILSDDVVIYNVYGTLTDLDYFVITEDKLVNEAATMTPIYYFAYNEYGEISAIVYNAALVNPDCVVVSAISNVINNGTTVQKLTTWVNGEKVSYLTTGTTVFPTSNYKGNLYTIGVDANGDISSATLVGATMSVTSSAITVKSNKGVFLVNGAAYSLADDAVVYEYTRTDYNALSAPTVGDVTSLDNDDCTVYLYNTNTKNDDNGITFEFAIVIQNAQ